MPRASSGPLRGAPASLLASLAPHSIVLVRDGTAQSAQSMWLDFSGSGRESIAGLAGVGFTGEASGVVVYAPTSIDIRVGDVFRHDDVQYTVRFVGPQGWGAVDGDTMQLAWCEAKRSAGV